MDGLRSSQSEQSTGQDSANQSKVWARIPPIRTKYRPEVRQSEQCVRAMYRLEVSQMGQVRSQPIRAMFRPGVRQSEQTEVEVSQSEQSTCYMTTNQINVKARLNQ